ncbi:MAG: glycosyltransferase family 2 protein [Clostridia bacterium]|nr:glycosyltransferase family 2 protein [Clostridia bacterium]
MNAPKLFIVIPCYNEEEALPITAARLTELTDDMIGKGLISDKSRIVLVDDGSKDKTWQVITALHEKDVRFRGVKLAHNAGHMKALWAGMTLSDGECDCLISIDADLQDDVNAMYGMIAAYKDGADVVAGVRSSRKTDSAFKRMTAQGFYKLMKKMGVEMVYDHADYRLLSARALSALLSFGEVNMFLRGMVPMLGFNTATVEYERGVRVAGESKYPLKKMVAFAVDGITSLSVKPIRMITTVGIIAALVGVGLGIEALVKVIGGQDAGQIAQSMSVWFLGGCQLTALGVVGEYIGKIYLETKRRPKFILDTYLKED